MTVIGRGKYRLREPYSYLELTERKWFNMTTVQKEGNMKKASNVPSAAACSSSSVTTSKNSLSVPSEAVSRGTHVSQDIIQGIWAKAEEYLNTMLPVVQGAHLCREWLRVESALVHTLFTPC